MWCTVLASLVLCNLEYIINFANRKMWLRVFPLIYIHIIYRTWPDFLTPQVYHHCATPPFPLYFFNDRFGRARHRFFFCTLARISYNLLLGCERSRSPIRLYIMRINDGACALRRRRGVYSTNRSLLILDTWTHDWPLNLSLRLGAEPRPRTINEVDVWGWVEFGKC